jgi:trimeric autotransporter adhesin
MEECFLGDILPKNLARNKVFGPYSHAEGFQTIANGEASHVEGLDSIATGLGSHAEGFATNAFGNFSHAEGNLTRSTGIASHAEGQTTFAVGDFSHAEGYETQAIGENSHVEGFQNRALRNSSHAEGHGNNAEGTASHAEGGANKALGDFSHAEGTLTSASGFAAHAEGNRSSANGLAAHAEGIGTIALGEATHAEGKETKATANFAHAEGNRTIAGELGAHAEGLGTEATGLYSHAEGLLARASGGASHAEGENTLAFSHYAHAEGRNTAAVHTGAHIMGDNSTSRFPFSWHLANGLTNGPSQNSAIIEGTTGNMYLDGTIFSPNAADYAEMFETYDMNPIMPGYFVTLEGDKIRKATADDHYILGVVSARPAIVADASDLRWHNLFVRDEWGNIQYHEVEIQERVDQEGKVIQLGYVKREPILNPEYDQEQKYIPRNERPEWAAVGVLGKLLVRDDGTCVVDQYCWSNNEGIATVSNQGYRVMRRLGPNQIQIFVK